MKAPQGPGSVGLATGTGNVQDDWPNVFQAFSVKFTFIFSRVCSFNHSTSAHVNIMHIDAKL